MDIYKNDTVNKIVSSDTIITSSYFKDLIQTPFLTLEGAYITYQITNINLYKGKEGPETDISSPQENDFYFNTSTKEEFKYSGIIWEELTTPLLDLLVETGFSSTWIPITTMYRDTFIELAIPKNYLPININESVNIFIGFKDIVNSSTIISSLGIPLSDSTSRYFSREVNTLIKIPIDFKCGFINLMLDSNLKKLENPILNTSLPTIGELISQYNSYSSDSSSVGAGNLSGTSLIL